MLSGIIRGASAIHKGAVNRKGEKLIKTLQCFVQHEILLLLAKGCALCELGDRVRTAGGRLALVEGFQMTTLLNK